MIKTEIINENTPNDYVYDISLDGTFVNAVGLNVLHNTDGFNFQLPDDSKFRYTEEHPYIGKGKNREVKKGEAYVGFEADVAEFNDMFMDKVYSSKGVNKMGLGIDEVVDSTINLSRKNYADYFPDNPFPKDVKLVGNTIKSKKMPEYIAVFLSKAIRHLLRGDGKAFLDEYYSYIEKIYNYRIPLKQIATKGKIKKSIQQYLKDIKEVTKAGRPKSRQAWYELAIQNNVHVGNGDTLYYVNTGTSKSHADVKKITHYYEIDEHGEKIDITKLIEKEYKEYNKTQKNKPTHLKIPKSEWISKNHPSHFIEEEIILNSMLVPRWIIDSDDDKYCSDMGEGFEYNCPKYLEMFNKRIKPLLVCFDKNIRDSILITEPKDRKYYTEEECDLVSGQPNKPSDQDTYEQLMTMEDKEIRFWMKYNLTPPFIEECGMGTWEEIVNDYTERKEKEKRLGIDKEREALANVIQGLSKIELDSFIEDNEIPEAVLKVSTLNPESFSLMSKTYPDMEIGNLNDLVERYEQILVEDEML